ncbi:MAG: hypothetical protein ACU0D1_01950 [Pseudooceanicola nanhaiensis]
MIGLGLTPANMVGEPALPPLPTGPALTTIAADGWQATHDGTPPAEMDPVGAPESFTVTRGGYDASGSAITVDDTITLMKRVREPYPSQASLTALMVALSDFVYSADAIAGVTNNSTRAYPKPQAMWATLDFARATTSSFDVRMVVAHAHAHARQGRPVAAVKFTASDGTNTAEVTVSSMTPVSYSKTGLTVPLFEGTLDLSGLDEGEVTIDATIYPWIGDAFTISTDAVASASSTINLCPLTILNDRAGGIGTAYAYVDDTTGDDGTGVVSETPATAAATPYATASAAVTALTSYNNANFGRNDAGGAMLRFNDGTHTLGSIKGAAGSSSWPIYVEGESEAGTFVQDAGSSTQNSIPHFIHFQDLTFQKTGDYIFLDNGTGGTVAVMTLKNVTCEVLAGGGYGAWAYRMGRILAENSEIGVLASGFSTVSKHINAVGSDIGGADRVYNAAACTGARIGQKTAAGNQVAGVGQCFMHNMISRGDTGQLCVKVAAQVGARGIAIVGNVVEKWGGDTTPAVQINADGNGSAMENVVYFGNTVVGSRTNFGYLDSNGMTNVDKSGYRRFNVEYLWNCKSDVFASNGSLVGNWPVRFNVGSRANVALEGSNNGSGYNASNWIGEVAAFGDLVGSSGTPVDPDWTDDASYQGTRTGGGDYSPGASTELPTIPAGLAPYSHDLTGNALADNGSDYVGAVAA